MIVRDLPDASSAARKSAMRALDECFHNWLTNVDLRECRFGYRECSVCGKTGRSRGGGPT